MTTVYFTNNNDSGDGSLRSALASASAGNVVAPDPDVFAAGSTITIALSSYLAITTGVSIEGAGRRIRLDGQGATSCCRLMAALDGDVYFSDVDFVRGYLSSFGACLYVASGASGTAAFDRCLFAGSHRPSAGGAPLANFSTDISIYVQDSILDKSDQTSCVYTASGCDANFTGCDLLGAVPAASTIYATDCIQTTTPETAGFVSYPTGARTIDDWTTFDLRLTLDSAFISGAETLGTDFEGRARLANGCLGAFANIRKLQDAETFDIDSRATAYVLEGSVAIGTLTCSGALVFPSEERTTGATTRNSAFVAVTTAAAFNGATASGVGYLALPPSTDVSGLTAGSDVRVCDYGAGVGAFRVKVGAVNKLKWTRANDAATVLVEKLINDEWTTLAANATTSATDDSPVEVSEYRIFDGAGFHFCSRASTPHAWLTYSATIVGEAVASARRYDVVAADCAPYRIVTGFIMMSSYYNRGETPVLFARIVDSEYSSPIVAEDVSSIKYTVYKTENVWGVESRTAVAGHSNVSVPTSAILDDLVDDDPRWTVDEIGYNFIFEPDARTTALFADAGRYVIVVSIEFVIGNPAPISYEIQVN